MIRRDYEVCVVGGGIAGSTLAYNLAPHFDVCLIEKDPIEEAGSKPCGEAVHLSWLKDGVSPKPWELGAVSARVGSIRLHLDVEELEARLPPGRELLILDRRKLVEKTLELALEGGCDLFEGRARPKFEDGMVREVRVDGGVIEAGLYVDASGVGAILRRNFKSSSSGDFFRSYREIVDGGLEDESCHVFQDDSSCALWAFPKGGRANVGAGAFRDGSRLRSEVGRLKGRLGLTGEVLESGFGLIPSSRPVELVHGNTVAIGDAGLTVNPLTGGGIGPSLKAANLLAEVLVEGGDPDDFQGRYRGEVARGYGRNYYLSRLFLRLQDLLWKRVAKWAFRRYYEGEPVD